MNFYQPFEEIKEEMRQLYLQDDCPFVLATSFGKDSTLQLLLLWETLLTIPKEQRKKKVYVISSDTLVEMDSISSYFSTSLDMVKKQAENLDLPIEVRKTSPTMRERYFWNVLGKGNPPVVPKSQRFRWCTAKIKQNPLDRVMKEIQSKVPIGINQDFDLYLFLGTRDSESIQRKNSMEKFAIANSKFGRHSKYDRICVYYPIKHVHGSSLWGYLYDYVTLPWGMPLQTLESFYPEGMMECGLKTDGQQSSCGGGRNGCWTCTFVSEDTMLEEEIQKGNTSAVHLYEYKKLLAAIRNDIRYREPTKRNEHKKVAKRLQVKEEIDSHGNLFNTFEACWETQEKRLHEYHSFQRADDTDYTTGSLTFECRKKLLEHLLYTEQITGLTLIEQDEIEAILEVWREEGYSVSFVQPIRFDYDGAVVYDQNFERNEKETKNPNPEFWVTREFDLDRDALIEYINERQQATGKNYYYNLTHWDFGEKDAFVYNSATFLVCNPTVHSQKEAGAVIDEWLYPKPKVEQMDWDAFAQRYKDAALALISGPNYDHQVLEGINKVLITLGHEPV